MPRTWPALPGELDISFPSGGHEDEQERVVLTIHDATSRIVLMQVTLGFTEFFRAVRGRGRTLVTFEAHPEIGKYIGAEKEQKTIPIFVPRGLAHLSDPEHKRSTGTNWDGTAVSLKDLTTIDEIDRILRPYEIDGWKGSTADVLNWHCVVRDLPVGAVMQLKDNAGYDESEEGSVHNVGFARWLKDGKVVS